MSKWEDNIRKVEPYVPGEQPNFKGMIKLNTNENPYPPSPKVREALDNIDKDADVFKLYPHFNADMLRNELSNTYHVDKDNIFVGVGSDDVLAMAFLTFFNSDKPILFPNITYSFYDVWANLFNIKYERPLLDDNLKIKKEDYYKENGGVVIANPNAPTGIYEDIDFIEDIVKHNTDVVVIVDEAYIDFAGQSALSLIDKYENLLVVQTFSKSRSMAGMRIGYCFGSKKLIKAINTVKHSYNSYTMNYPSIVLGCASLQDKDYFKECVDKIVETREEAKKKFASLGFECTDSKTNFLLVTNKRYSAKELFTYLQSRNIFVRYFNKPIVDNYLRITIGTKDEMSKLFATIEEFLNKER